MIENNVLLEKEKNSYIKKFELFFQKPGLFPPDNFSEEDKESYYEAQRVFKDVFNLRKLFGTDSITPELGAEKYIELANRQKLQNSENLKKEIEEAIVLIGSVFQIATQKSGLGDLLSAYSRGLENAWADKIRLGTLKPIIQEAFKWLPQNINDKQ